MRRIGVFARLTMLVSPVLHGQKAASMWTSRVWIRSSCQHETCLLLVPGVLASSMLWLLQARPASCPICDWKAVIVPLKAKLGQP